MARVSVAGIKHELARRVKYWDASCQNSASPRAAELQSFLWWIEACEREAGPDVELPSLGGETMARLAEDNPNA